MCRLLPSLYLVLGLLLLGCPTAPAQSTFDLFGSARADGLSRATTAAPTAWGAHANPATNAVVPDYSVSFYAQEAFGLSSLRYGAVSLVAPFRWGAAIGGASTFGFEEYREMHFNAGMARSFSFGTTRSFHLGATLRYHHTRIAGYGSASGWALNLGLLVQMLPALHLGAHATNVNGASLTDGEALPRTLSMGLQYRAHEDIRVLVDLFKDVAFPATARMGLEVRPLDVLALRAGASTVPTQFSGGVGVTLGPLEADVAAQQHQELGWSPSATLRLYW